MFRTNATGSVANAYVNQSLPGTPGTVLDADDRNITQEEICNAVLNSDQALDPTGVDDEQLGRAIAIGGGVSQSCSSVGTANALFMLPVNAASPPNSYTQMDGFVCVFKVSLTNTLACTLTYNAIGADPLVNRDGSALVAGDLTAGDTAWVIRNNASVRWELMLTSTIAVGALTGLTGESGVVLIGGSAPVLNISIDPLGIGTAKIANLAVTEGKIANLAVTNGKIGNLAVTNGKIANGTIQFEKLSNSATESVNVQRRLARAWVRVNAFTGAPVIQEDFNVFSLTDNGTGRYSVNIDTDMSDSNYAVVGSGMQNSTDSGGTSGDVACAAASAGVVRVETWDDGSSHGDFYHSSIIVFDG